ncbi:MAG: phosphoribosyl-AMP cyclohydrolase [Candidatus Peribacteraceae bacterium]|nr:phosphoribosyl-AMP cyclohydrolase [Candidatus Peribacteraceae bacterium]
MPDFGKRGGLVTVVTQDSESRQVLMVAYANEEAFLVTLRTLKATYWSTSRKKLWIKGEESGNVQEVVDVLVDCDGDAVIYLVRQTGSGACHTGAKSCFYRSCIEARQLMDAPKAGENESLPVVTLSEAPVLVSIPKAQTQGSERLRVLVPTGSLSAKMKTYLGTVGYRMKDRDRKGYCGTVGNIDFFERDRRMIPSLLGEYFDVGITGKDLVMASGIQGLRTIAELPFSRASDKPTRWVLAALEDVRTMKRIRVGCELPGLAAMLLSSISGFPALDIVRIEGSEETAIKDGLCDAVLVVTESGESLTLNGLRIVEGADNLLLSYPEIVAVSSLSPARELLLTQLSAALEAAVGAESHVLITFDILQQDLEGLVLPAAVSPTVSQLRNNEWVAVQICVPRLNIGSMLAEVRRSGGKAIAVVGLVGWLP